MPKLFKTIARAKRPTAEAIKALGAEKFQGENRLEVRNEADTFKIYLSGTVGSSWWDEDGIKSKEFREALDSIPKGKQIHVHYNSEGGEVQTGLDIYNATKARAGFTTGFNDGYCCSIASVMPLACDKVVSPKSSIWMIHRASCGCGGNADAMEEAATMLREHDEMLADVIAAETGQSKEKIQADMKAETWIRGALAIDYGLADESGDADVTDNLTTLPKAWLDRCKNIPANIYNSLLISNAQQGAEKKPTQQKPQSNMKKKLLALLQANNVSDATDAKTLDELIELAQSAVTDGKLPAAKFENWQTESFPKNVRTVVVDDTSDAKLNKIIRDRIADKIDDFIADGKITKDEREIWIEAAILNDTKTFNILAAKTAQSAGGAAAGADIEVRGPELPVGLCGRPSPKLQNLAGACNGDRTKILAAMKKDYNLLLQDALRSDSVRNENTFTSTFTTNFLILEATVQGSPRFASMNLFARDVKVDPMKPLSSGIYQFNNTAQDGSTSQTNATNFESGDSTLTPVTVTVAQYTESFHVTNGQLNSGLRMENLVKNKLNSLGSKISQVIGSKISAATFATLPPLITSFGAFNSSNTQTILAAIAKANLKNIMLDGGYFYKLTNVPSLFQPQPFASGGGFKNGYGFDNVALHTEWSQSGANIHGFAGDETSLGLITGLPLMDVPAIPGGILSMANGTIPGVDCPITAYAWFNTATRTYWASLDTMFGCNALDTSVGMVIATGTPS